jgi:hypothetical protein
MPGLKDIAPSFTTVTVKGVSVPVSGISAEGIAYLFHRFPVVRELISGKPLELTADELLELGPDAVGALIATGCGDINDPAAEKAAKGLPLEAQVDLLEAIIGETMPSGAAPFVQRLSKMFKGFGLDVESMSIPAGK